LFLVLSQRNMTMVAPEAAPVDNPARPLPKWYPKCRGKPWYNGNPEVSTIMILYLFSKDDSTSFHSSPLLCMLLIDRH
jgi:hypothetical protein